MTDPSEGRAQRDLHEGPVRGGPLDRTTLTSRFPSGVVAVSIEHSKVWVYDFVDDHFQVRDAAGVELDQSKLNVAVDGADHDVVVVG